MSETAYLIIAISSLATAVVTLWVQNGKLHKKYVEMLNQNTVSMTNAVKENARSNEHLANSIDTLPERIVDKMLANGFKKK